MRLYAGLTNIAINYLFTVNLTFLSRVSLNCIYERVVVLINVQYVFSEEKTRKFVRQMKVILDLINLCYFNFVANYSICVG